MKTGNSVHISDLKPQGFSDEGIKLPATVIIVLLHH